MVFEEYVTRFMSNLLDYYQATKTLETWFPNNENVKDIILKLKNEYMCDEKFKDTTVDNFLANDWLKFQMILAYNYSLSFYNDCHVFSFIDYIHFRDMIEQMMMEDTSDQSIYTRIVNRLNIPAKDLPNEYVQLLYSSDEFMFATNFFLKLIHSDLTEPDEFINVDQYRVLIEPKIENAINELNNKGYFGTYDKAYMIELCIAYKLGLPAIGPLYITSKFPKNLNKYEDLKEYVNRLWNQKRDQPGIPL